MEFDEDEYKATQDLHYKGNIEEIRQKSVYRCTEQELRLRVKFDEEYIKKLEEKIQQHKDIYNRNRDCYEEFE